MVCLHLRHPGQILIGVLPAFEPLHVIGACHHDNVLRFHAGVHSLPDLLAHIRLAEHRLRPVIFFSFRETSDIGAKIVRPHMISFHAPRLFHDALPECIVPVLTALLVELLIDTDPCLLPLRFLHTAFGDRQKGFRGQIHETALHMMLMTPPDRLIFR